MYRERPSDDPPGVPAGSPAPGWPAPGRRAFPPQRRRPVPKLRLCLLSCLVALTLPACSRWIVTAPAAHGDDPVPLPTREPALFAYALPAPTPRLQPAHDRQGRPHRLERLTFPSVGENGQAGNLVQADYHVSAQAGAHPVVIVLPLWGKSAYPPKAVTRTLLRRGGDRLSVLRVRGERYLFDWDALAAAGSEDEFRRRVREMASRMRATVIDLRRLIDWLGRREEVDPERIGVVGFSMSAVVGAQLLGADDRIRSAVLMMGGANLEEIIARCNGPLAQVRRRITTRFGWTLADYEAAVGEAFGALNPERFPARTPPGNILMIDSHYDECMPESARDAYWNALGRPRRLSLLAGHRRAFWSLTPIGFSRVRRTVYETLEAGLMEDSAAPAGDRGPAVRSATAK